MDAFNIYFHLGYKHIIDPAGIDHILFIAVLVAIYKLSEWRKVLVLITAFTIGHSVTLALASYQIIRFDRGFVELLIPITILITAILNFYNQEDKTFTKSTNLKYILAIFFGLIHGLAFSNTLQGTSNIILPLFAFNIGLEVGQIIVVLVLLLLSTIITDIIKLITQKYWNYGLSSLAGIIAVIILVVKAVKIYAS